MSMLGKKRLVVVLGMHRSGTSAITKSLELLGVGLGNDLHPPGFDNPKGFWEDRDCIEINDTLLAHLGSAYDRLGLAWDEIQADSMVTELKSKAVQLISRKLKENKGLWGFKDPRTCRLLVFWSDVFSTLNCEVSFVIAGRNPASVAASLAARNNMPVEKAYILWLQHVLPILSITKESRSVVVDYDELLANPYPQVVRIASKLGLLLPDRHSVLVKDFENNFLEAGLRHASFTEEQLACDKRAPAMVVATYNLLYRLAKDQEELENLSVQAALDELKVRLREIKPLCDYINHLEDDRVNLWRASAVCDSQVVNLTQAVAANNKQVVELTQAITAREVQLADFSQAVAMYDKQLADFAQVVAVRDHQIGDLTQAVAVYEKQVVDLTQAIADRDVQIAEFTQVVGGPSTGRISGFAQAGLMGFSNQLVGECDAQLSHLNQFVVMLNSQIESLLSSKSFYITKPLRFVGRVVRGELENVMAPFVGTHIKNTPMHTIGQIRVELETLITKIGLSKKKLAEIETRLLAESASNFVKYQKNCPIHPLVKLIAFYLPQFHPFRENDEWWGKGFTEWTNVGRALPNYVGHYQPHCPIHHGYYDLRVPKVMEEQARLAREYGIYGFSYYFYWFDGNILMDMPLESMLANKKVDIPFCLTWANENWSRRWDGREDDVLISQNHSDKDSLAFIRHLVKYFQDERYIRIDGKPVLIIYRADMIPNMAATAKIWRDEMAQHGIGGLYLIAAQSFDIRSPVAFDFDASVEFPPHTVHKVEVGDELELINPDFKGHIYNYEQVVANAILSEEPDYKLYRTAMLTWDNTARRQFQSTIFHGFSLQLYQEWLSSIIDKVSFNPKYNADEKLVFVNAWNEWAEGTHLEPDQKFGYGYLQTTYDALRHAGDPSHQIIIVTHDAYPHGAQYLALNMARDLAQGFGFRVEIICLGGGVLMERFTQYGRLHDLTGIDPCGSVAHDLAQNLMASGYRFAIVNTTVSGLFLQTLKTYGIKSISLVHELRGVIDQYNLHEHAKTIAKLADKVVFPAQQVADEFQEIASVSDVQRVLRPQGLYKKNVWVSQIVTAREELRKVLDLPPEARIVLSVGYADQRKGVDLFVEAGKILVGRLPDVYLVWLGHWEEEMQARVELSLSEDIQLRARFIFPGRREDTDIFYAGADVYALTSREDPFPSVVLEAMDVSLPVVGFEGVGGYSELLEVGCGKLVPAFDVKVFSSVIENILEDYELANHMGKIGQALIRERFSFRNYLFDLLKLLEYPLPRVSVVVPNYNYAHFLPGRISTIESQEVPVYELILLDDCSSDVSETVIKNIIQDSALDIKFVCNKTNSGSVFSQWHKGVELATGDLVWIAEADDLSEPEFLTDVLQGFVDPDVVLSYCESKQINSDGKVLCDNYLDYVADIDSERWLKPYIREGRDEIVDALSVKNTIPNVSAVVFRRDILSEVLTHEKDQVSQFSVAGDWYIYAKVLERGKIAFNPYSFNLHRRHTNSVTNASLNFSQFAEIVRVQRMVAANFDVSDARREMAQCYAQKLYEQFGLATSDSPSFE